MSKPLTEFLIYLNARLATEAFEKAKGQRWYQNGDADTRYMAGVIHAVDLKLIKDHYSNNSKKDILIDYLLRQTNYLLRYDYTTIFVPAAGKKKSKRNV